MRAKNREINIFNISLLDILTGMLGAFLFLMLGLVPYYSKVVKGNLISEEEKRKFDELKKLLEKGLKGPLSPEEVAQLQGEMDRLNKENQQLRGENEQLQSDLRQTKQELQAANQEKDFWSGQGAIMALTTVWDSADADIDIMILAPDGTIYGPKKEKILGKDVFKEGLDSHGVGGNGTPYTSSIETSAFELGPGDYLIFYRVPTNAPPAAYANLSGYWVSRDVAYDPTQVNKGAVWVLGNPLGASNSSRAKPGGLYAWASFTYDPAKRTISWKPTIDKLPNGIQLP